MDKVFPCPWSHCHEESEESNNHPLLVMTVNIHASCVALIHTMLFQLLQILGFFCLLVFLTESSPTQVTSDPKFT